ATFTNKTDSIFLGECTWDFGFGETLKSCNKNIPRKTFKAEGSYDIKLVIVAPLSTQCADSLTKVDGVIVYPKPVVDFDYTPQPVTIENSKVRMLNKTINGYSYKWIAYNLDGSVLATSDEMEPYIKFPQADEGEYPVWLEAVSEFGCKADFTKVIIIEGVMLVSIPNSFTPNGDGVNDVFGPIIYGAYTDQDFTFSIFNRWGEELFMANQYDNERAFWDGTYKDSKLSDGTYIYKLVVKSLYSEKIEEFYGEFSLLR
ncbi:MAG: gliding motility-associated-like protein, partial [Flavobacteriales bacterium]